MDIQNSNVSIQINAKDLSGKTLRVADCDEFFVHVYTDDPKLYLTFSKREMLMTEYVDELVIPAHLMNQLRSGVVQYTYHYLPVNHDCHCHHDHGHKPHHEDMIHSRPVVTSIYWRNIKNPHPHHQINHFDKYDLEKLHKRIDNEIEEREESFKALQQIFTEGYEDKLNAEIERSTSEDENLKSEIESVKSLINSNDGKYEEINNKVNQDITANQNDIADEVSRAKQREFELEQLIEVEANRAKAAEELIDSKITLEKERAQANEANINDRLVSIIDRFDAHKELINETVKSEVERAKATEAALNDKIQGVVSDLNAEVSRAAQKDIEHTNLVETEANRAKAVENRLDENLTTEIQRAKDAEKHILDEVHDSQEKVVNLNAKVNSIENEIDTVNNWINNHVDNTDELKTKVSGLVEDVDKAKSDILAEIAKCDAENNKLSTDIQTLTGKVDTEIDRAKAMEAELSDEITGLKSIVNEKTVANADSIAGVEANLVKEIARAKAAEKVNADAIEIINGDNATSGSIKKSLQDSKDYTDGEITKLSLAFNVELTETLRDYTTNADVEKKISDVIGTAPEALDTLGKISNALSADNDAITAINGVLTGKANADDVYTKPVVDLKLTEVVNSISTLETKSDNADSVINSRIDDLAAKVTANETANANNFTALSSSISDEEIARKEADKALTDKFDAKTDELSSKISDVNANLIQDIAKSDAKDIELQANIDAEVTRATAREDVLESLINQEIEAGAKIESTLFGQGVMIDSLETAVANEKTRAEAVEQAIEYKINIINGGEETVGSIQHAVHDAKHYTDDEISNLKNEVSDLVETSVANSGKWIAIYRDLNEEVLRAQNAEKEIYDSINNVADTLEAAIEDLNNLFESGNETGNSGSGNAGDSSVNVDLEDYYTKEEVNDLILTAVNDALEGTLKSQKLSAEEYAALEASGEVDYTKLYIIV